MSESNANSTASSRSRPQVWLLLGEKAGDNNQVLALAEQLAWPWIEKRIAYRSWELLSNLSLRVTLRGMDRKRSSLLEPPWPELVISSGRRNEPVARWIKRQSGNATRIVHLGRPWAAADVFDLVICTPQYAVPDQPNVLLNELPLHRLTAASLNQAARGWNEAFAQLPRPRTVVLLGGNSGACVFTEAKARRLGVMVNGLVRSQRGSVLLTDSARTPPGVVEAFCAELDAPLHSHRWGSVRESNPYLAYLAVADQFVVTADSMSMLAEASFCAKPVYLFSLEDGVGWWKRPYNYRFSVLSHRVAMAVGPRRMRRDVNAIIDRLRSAGRAAWLGEALRAPVPMAALDERMRSALAVADLFTSSRARHRGR